MLLKRKPTIYNPLPSNDSSGEVQKIEIQNREQ